MTISFRDFLEENPRRGELEHFFKEQHAPNVSSDSDDYEEAHHGSDLFSQDFANVIKLKQTIGKSFSSGNLLNLCRELWKKIDKDVEEDASTEAASNTGYCEYNSKSEELKRLLKNMGITPGIKISSSFNFDDDVVGNKYAFKYTTSPDPKDVPIPTLRKIT
ncbi:hypothetical protein BdWA1_001563 [Babesia duncani]|uniref:Uncharacterized protein n=1 Tax=Babesia duncani TaxID=323732 RepID=A0AAD9PK52_9APIC|nr:hypothetical protein BdWA1_001563 [Babesia duncani]